MHCQWLAHGNLGSCTAYIYIYAVWAVHKGIYHHICMYARHICIYRALKTCMGHIYMFSMLICLFCALCMLNICKCMQINANACSIAHQFLLANGASMGVCAGIVVIYMGIEKNSVDGPACCSAIVASFLLSFRKLKNI